MIAFDCLFFLLSPPAEPSCPTLDFLRIHSGLDSSEVSVVVHQCGASLAACRLVAFACDGGMEFTSAVARLPRGRISTASYAMELIRMAEAILVLGVCSPDQETWAAALALRGLPVHAAALAA